jgi:hypothetical protein
LHGREHDGRIAATERGREAMRDIDLFQMALGLAPPWMVTAADFDAEKKRLDIDIDFKTGGRFTCPERTSRHQLAGERRNLLDAADRRYAVEDNALPLDPAMLR